MDIYFLKKVIVCLNIWQINLYVSHNKHISRTIGLVVCNKLCFVEIETAIALEIYWCLNCPLYKSNMFKLKEKIQTSNSYSVLGNWETDIAIDNKWFMYALLYQPHSFLVIIRILVHEPYSLIIYMSI